MKSLVFRGKERIDLAELPTPTIAPDEILLRVRSVGICGTDLHIYHGGMSVPAGTVLGHEFSGVVEEVGALVRHVRPGDRAVAEHVVSCGKCRYCIQGKPNLCLDAKVIGVHRPGALAEFVALPASLVVPFPETLNFDEAALVEPLSIALYAVRESGFLLGRKVAVIGQGPIGLLLDQVLRLAGARVCGIDVREETLRFAREKGWVESAENPARQGFRARLTAFAEDGFDAVYEVVGKEETAEMALEIARRDGEVFVLGVFESPARLDLMQVVKKELRVSGSYTCAFSFPQAIDLAARGKVDLQSLVTHSYAIEEGSRAFLDASRYAESRIKTLIRL